MLIFSNRDKSKAMDFGKNLRKNFPRVQLASLGSTLGRDPVKIITEQNKSRLPHLIPLRIERLLVNSFTFYRATAAIMAADLATEQRTGIDIVISGDAHLENFGLYASPDRQIVFDINDFDEATIGPWEWDIKRFATSIIVAARTKNISDNKSSLIANKALNNYIKTLKYCRNLSSLDRYYLRAQPELLEDNLHISLNNVFEEAIKKAKKRNSIFVARKMTEINTAGKREFKPNPPILTRLNDNEYQYVEQLFKSYLHSIPPDIYLLLQEYELVDIAMRVVGVGSVGTRCYIIYLEDQNKSPLVLQLKEANKSALNEWGGLSDFRSHLDRTNFYQPNDNKHGRRVVTATKVMQAVSDSFLGWASHAGQNFYVRQFRDMKGSIDVTNLTTTQFEHYVRLCGVILARAHAQSVNADIICGYLGNSTKTSEYLTNWALKYADRIESDFEIVRKTFS